MENLMKKAILLGGIIFIFFNSYGITDAEKCLKEKDGEACYSEALKYVNSDLDLSRVSIPESFLKWAEKGCEYKYSSACDSLFRFWHIKNDKDKAFKYGVMSCELSKSEVTYLDEHRNKFNRQVAFKTCVFLANVYYFPDDSIYKNKEKAIDLSLLACKNEVVEGCLMAGLMYRKLGKEIESDKWLQWGCLDRQESLCCVVLIEKYYELQNKEKTDFYFKKLGFSFPHATSGFFYMAKTTWTIKKDVKRTTQWLEMGLNKGGVSIDMIEKEVQFKDLRETKEYVEMVEKFKTD